MRSPEEELLEIIKASGVDLLLTLPCDRVKAFIGLADRYLSRLPLTREEEGVGIAAGAALAGRRPAMVVQSSGVGNMVNALLSLTRFYELPLALFISHRGVYREGIAAQVPMGRALPGLLEAMHIPFSTLKSPEEFSRVGEALESLYREGRIHAFLLVPSIWEGSEAEAPVRQDRPYCEPAEVGARPACPPAGMRRYEIIQALRPALEGNVVVSNLGVPSKELYHVLPQPSNFYMLGSMGMATPIGLGLALSTPGRVFVIDGDGSLLMNPGTLATAALAAPENLTVLCVDNASYGSTGEQPTLTGTCVDLEAVARGMGIKRTARVWEREGLLEAARRTDGPLFIHALARPGNARVPDIPLSAGEIKGQLMGFLSRTPRAS
ncbi:MAG: sulfopyruvate decarboxylase subunit alpha [Nitrospirota bacterium]